MRYIQQEGDAIAWSGKGAGGLQLQVQVGLDYGDGPVLEVGWRVWLGFHVGELLELESPFKGGGIVVAAPEHDAYLFPDLSDKYQTPLIPIINSNNAGATTIAAAHTAAAAKVVDVLLAELSVPFRSAF